MTRKDYILIAKHLKWAWDTLRDDDSRDLFMHVVQNIEHALSEDNGRFNVKTFREAIYGKEAE